HKKKRFDKFLLDLIKNNIKNPLFAMLLVFIAGFLTSLTPCVYPMIPITISYFGRRSQGQKMKNSFLESILYVLGLSITYTLLGIIAAITGSAFGSLTQNPWVLTVFAGLFFLMAFMMCDYLPLPGISLAAGAQGKVMQKRTFFQPMLLGLITGLVASPCVGPVVLFLLALIINTGSIFYGAILMFVFSLGLGVIFIVIGTFSGLINKLPKAGKWMETVEVIFSILMVMVASYFLNLGLKGFKIAGSAAISVGFAIMFITFFLGLFNTKPFTEKDPFKKKKYEMIFFILLIIFLIGFSFLAKGIIYRKSDPARITRKSEDSSLIWYDTIDKGLQRAKVENKFIFVDFRADWCAVCKEFESAALHDEKLQKVLEKYITVRLDYDSNKEIAKGEYKVMGLPTFLILDQEGSVLHRESGFLNLKAFINDLEEITNGLLPTPGKTSK
ncbi:sulfite exporter TauE/SafE family protein, partial [bacterium]|nr:sulfite exporter TauE/SafE family protein [bacterium]